MEFTGIFHFFSIPTGPVLGQNHLILQLKIFLIISLTTKTIICYQTVNSTSSYIYCDEMNNKKVFDYKKNRPWAENLQIVMQLGLTMVGCIIFCLFVGYQIDKWLGTRGIFITLFIFLGVIGGAVVTYRQIMDIYKDTDSSKDGHNGAD